MRPISPRPNGPGTMIEPPAAAPIRCLAPSGCFCPCAPAAALVGVVGIDSDKPGPLLTPDQRRLLDALIDQAALAIERVHLVDDLDQAKRRVEADRLRAALLTSISHDLKTPLASIVGAAGALKDLSGALDDAAKADLVATILEESERLNRFIANLLDMTRLESGSIKPNTARHDIGEIVGSVLERARKILVHHRVEVDIAKDLPMLELDPVLFEQVLFNLLDNAAKYASPQTTVLIQSWQEAETVKLQIVDEGSGIPPGGDRSHLRQVPSRREAGSGSRRHRTGTGDLPRLHRSHGRLDHRGEPDRPAWRRVHHHAPGPQARRAAGHRRMSAAPLKVLVIDDEPPIRKLLRMGLETQGYQTMDASNAKAALELMSDKPDLVILDLGLPDMQGLELLAPNSRSERGPARRRALEPRR